MNPNWFSFLAHLLRRLNSPAIYLIVSFVFIRHCLSSHPPGCHTRCHTRCRTRCHTRRWPRPTKERRQRRRWVMRDIHVTSQAFVTRTTRSRPNQITSVRYLGSFARRGVRVVSDPFSLSHLLAAPVSRCRVATWHTGSPSQYLS